MIRTILPAAILAVTLAGCTTIAADPCGSSKVALTLAQAAVTAAENALADVQDTSHQQSVIDAKAAVKAAATVQAAACPVVVDATPGR
jgi:uncharacterized protein YfiM (DUF2279 family)